MVEPDVISDNVSITTLTLSGMFRIQNIYWYVFEGVIYIYIYEIYKRDGNINFLILCFDRIYI